MILMHHCIHTDTTSLNNSDSDINECAAGTHNCDANAACANSEGAFSCSCNSGYEEAGTGCTGKH